MGVLHRGQVTKASALLVVLASAGCASNPPTAKEQIAYEYRLETTRIEVIEEFERRKITCAQSGGFLQVRRLSRARRPPTVNEMKTATCERFGSLF